MTERSNDRNFIDVGRENVEEIRTMDEEKGCCEIICPCLCKKDPSKPVKILLLGTGGSGKSTVMKQIMFNKRSKVRMEKYRVPVIENLFDTVIQLVEGMETLGLNFANAKNQQTFAELMHAKDLIDSTLADWNTNKKNYVAKMRDIWHDATIKNCLDKRRNEFYLNDSTDYFIKNVDKFLDDRYVPTKDDALRVRQPTTGIVRYQLQIDDTQFEFIDVGGQLSERSKWIHCINDTLSLIFVASLSDYELYFTENELKANNLDPKKKINRLQESLRLFDLIINWKLPNTNTNREELLFKRTGLLVFFNKTDLFKERINPSLLENCFPDINKAISNNAENAGEFIKTKFLACDKLQREIFTHFTCAVDTKAMKAVIENVKQSIFDIMIRELAGSGNEDENMNQECGLCNLL